MSTPVYCATDYGRFVALFDECHKHVGGLVLIVSRVSASSPAAATTDLGGCSPDSAPSPTEPPGYAATPACLQRIRAPTEKYRDTDLGRPLDQRQHELSSPSPGQRTRRSLFRHEQQPVLVPVSHNIWRHVVGHYRCSPPSADCPRSFIGRSRQSPSRPAAHACNWRHASAGNEFPIRAEPPHAATTDAARRGSAHACGGIPRSPRHPSQCPRTPRRTRRRHSW